DGSARGIGGPSSAARGAANAPSGGARARPTSAQASAIDRRYPTSVSMRTTSRSGLLDLDLARHDLQLRGHAFEWLPRHRFALQVGGGCLIDERAVGVTRRDRPNCGPEIVGGRIVAARMRAVLRVQLLPVGQFNHQALEPILVEDLAILVEHAEAPHDFFQMLE